MTSEGKLLISPCCYSGSVLSEVTENSVRPARRLRYARQCHRLPRTNPHFHFARYDTALSGLVHYTQIAIAQGERDRLFPAIQMNALKALQRTQRRSGKSSMSQIQFHHFISGHHASIRNFHRNGD
jgi:hypothetical protein